ncbi:hypothetical protein [Mycolicibacter hiberniae]|uniref:Uncharacterized protein n=1 Tax=Mycolicibacter hiberniae TaxID=29314 RepID=A0A7I7X647_9MYCO|nr:hypothetical protein [Mycolicibacter hiberniae]MCV7085023.1 hypothetical protein [Mycolicibacter hiberniae]ORV68660.1 hypothetical protein AWC09_14995 [Mycolicibacter hiberniae]BBZ25309.1 hypothetical protein MHIB_37270 [Mycolicibacter hiberniae]
MTGILIATLALLAYSLWVRRDTWSTRWENAATLALALLACALLLMSPWAAADIGPVLHDVLGVWNTPALVGHLCLIVAVTANIYHMLLRLADPVHVRVIMRRHLLIPIVLGVAVMVLAYLRSDQTYQRDVLAAPRADGWMLVYFLVGGSLALYLSAYSSRLMLALRHDPRAKRTLDLHLVSMTAAIAAGLLVVGSSWVAGDDASPGIWFCICVAGGTFAYGSARSWKAKSAWFAPGDRRR